MQQLENDLHAEAEHHPELFTNDISRCPEYMCKVS